jgi:hypothetical protein
MFADQKSMHLFALLSMPVFLTSSIQSSYTLRQLERNTIGNVLVQQHLNTSIGGICIGTMLLFIYLLMNLSLFWNSLIIVNMIFIGLLFVYQLRFIFWMKHWQQHYLDEALLDNPIQ